MVSGLKKNSVSAGDKIGIEHKNPEMGAVGAIGGWGGKPSLFEGCLVVQYSTVLYKERKEIEVVYNYRLHSRSIHPESPLSQKERQKLTSSTSALSSFPTVKKSTFSLFVYKLTLL